MPNQIIIPAIMKARAWCFTLNNPHVMDPPYGYVEMEENLKTMDPEYYVFSLEVGEQGTYHYQGFMYFKNARGMESIKKHLNCKQIHLEKARAKDLKDAANYCKKEPIEGPWEYGELPQQGKRTDLTEFVKDIRSGMSKDALLDKHATAMALYPRFMDMVTMPNFTPMQEERTWKTEVIVCYGGTGTGKSRAAYEAGAKFLQPTKSGFINGYYGQPIVCFDDFDPETIPFRQLLNYMDRYPIVTNVKSAYKIWNPRQLWITAEKHPSEWYPLPPESLEQLMRRIDKLLHYPLQVTTEVQPTTTTTTIPVSNITGSGAPLFDLSCLDSDTE